MTLAYYRSMPPLRTITAAAALTLVCAVWPASQLRAQYDQPPELTGFSIGFGGKFKSGFWQPVWVTLTAGKFGAQGRLELVAADGDQTPVIYTDPQAAELVLGNWQQSTILLYAKSGPISSPIKAQFRMRGQVVWQKELATPTLGATHELVVGIGPDAGLAQAAATLKRRPEATLATAQVTSADELPDAWWGYSGVDAVVLTTSDAAFLDVMTAAQRQALIDWVLLGGRMVLSVGARGEEITAAGSPWATLVPGNLAEVVPLRERAGLETFSRSELPFDEEFFQRNRPRITRLQNVRGEVLFGEATVAADRPLAIRAAAGFGEVTFLALDLDHPSLAAWEGHERLITALVARGPQQGDAEERESQRTVGHLGYTDLAGQFRFALEQFSGVWLLSFTTVAVLTIVYLLLVAPLDYLLWSRPGWPRQYTWFTFPLVALAATLAFAYVGRQAHGTRTRLNQAEIIDIDFERKLVRGTAWTHLYSPQTAHRDAELKIGAPATLADSPQGWLAWQGLPGDALGGLGSRQVVLATADPYQVALPSARPRVTSLPTPIASSKSLTARWWAHSPLAVESRLALDQFGLLGGEFTQPLDVELENCILAHGEKLFRLGNLRPGQRVLVDRDRSLNLQWRLTERRIEQSKDVSTPWNQGATDVPQIVQIMMFHQAAGGRSYTGLTHRYQPEIDLSDHVRLGQAVLVGRAKQPVVNLEQGGQPLAQPSETTTWTWYRLILPVQPLTPGS